ncbi:MAG: glycosyltransferase [Oligoflexus sp.]
MATAQVRQRSQSVAIVEIITEIFGERRRMRVAYVHDWLVTYRGGERVLEAMLDLYPEAPVYTLFYDPRAMPASITRRDVRVDPWLNALRPLRKALLPILPSAIEALPLEDFDLILSTSSCVAKGVMVGPDSRHLCYIHSPMRYIWDQRQHYLVTRRNFSPFEALVHHLSHKLRMWDVTSSNRVDRFVANSSFVQKRVQRYYGRNASVIHPPVDVDRFRPQSPVVKPGYLLAAGAFVSYKRFDLAIAACEQLGQRLVIAGSGPDERRLRRLAGRHTEFRIQPDASQWVRLFQEADALLFPGVEDFGITAIEAMGAGTPVIALRAGGALDFILEGETGTFFDQADVDTLRLTLERFKVTDYSTAKLLDFAQTFHKSAFLQQLRMQIAELEGGA